MPNNSRMNLDLEADRRLRVARLHLARMDSSYEETSREASEYPMLSSNGPPSSSVHSNVDEEMMYAFRSYQSRENRNLESIGATSIDRNNEDSPRSKYRKNNDGPPGPRHMNNIEPSTSDQSSFTSDSPDNMFSNSMSTSKLNECSSHMENASSRHPHDNIGVLRNLRKTLTPVRRKKSTPRNAQVQKSISESPSFEVYVTFLGDPCETQVPKGNRIHRLMHLQLWGVGDISLREDYNEERVKQEINKIFARQENSFALVSNPYEMKWKVCFAKGTGNKHFEELKKPIPPSGHVLYTRHINHIYCVPKVTLCAYKSELTDCMCRLCTSSDAESDEDGQVQSTYTIDLTLKEGNVVIQPSISGAESTADVMDTKRELEMEQNRRLHLENELEKAKEQNKQIEIDRNSERAQFEQRLHQIELQLEEARRVRDSNVDWDQSLPPPEERLVYGIESYRDRIYDENTGTTDIQVTRQPIGGTRIHEYLRVISKLDPTDLTSFFRKPVVYFNNEPGLDAGALMREFSYQASSSWVRDLWTPDGGSKKIPLFEGTDDLWLPTSDTAPVDAGIFRLIGISMIYFAVHSDFAFLGLHRLCSKYILEDRVERTKLKEWDVTPADIPDETVRAAVIGLTDIEKGLWVDNVEDIQSTLNDYKIGVDVSNSMDTEEAAEGLQLLYYEYLFGCRLQALKSLRSTFRSHVFWNWVKTQEYLLPKLFPRSIEFPMTAENIMFSFTNAKEFPLYSQYLLNFLSQEEKRGEKLHTFLVWLTCYPVILQPILQFEEIPATRSIISPATNKKPAGAVEFVNNISANTCSFTLQIPVGISESQFISQLHFAVNECDLEFTCA